MRKKEISFYHTLNILSVDVTKKCLVGQGWSPVFATSQDALQHATLERKSQVVGSVFQVLNTKDSPPTYSRPTNLLQPSMKLLMHMGMFSRV